MDKKSIINNYIYNSSKLFKDFFFYKEIGSTNDECFKKASVDNFIIQTAKQNKGRGRYNRKWISPSCNNLYYSIYIYKPEIDYNFIVMLTAVSLIEVLQNYNPDIRLKWPNDIIYDNRKLSGILIEREFSGDKLKNTVIGAGINLFTDFDSLKELKDIGISLKDISTKSIDPDILLIDFLKIFEEYYIDFKKYKDDIIKTWMKNISGLDQHISFKSGNKTFKGILKGINSDGSITVEADNDLKTYQFGEII